MPLEKLERSPATSGSAHTFFHRLRRCKHCGYRLPNPETLHCQECGKAVDPSDTRLYFYGTEPSHVWKPWLYVCFLALVAALMLQGSGRLFDPELLIVLLLLALSVVKIVRVWLVSSPPAPSVAIFSREGYSLAEATFLPLFNGRIDRAIERMAGAGAVGVSWPVATLGVLCFGTFAVTTQPSRQDANELFPQWYWRRDSKITVRMTAAERIRIAIRRRGFCYLQIDIEGTAADVPDIKFVLEALRTLGETDAPLDSRDRSVRQYFDPAK